MGRAWSLALLAGLAALGPGAPAGGQQMIQAELEPAFSIWDVRLGEPLDQIPVRDVVELSCGTNGGPPSTRLRALDQFTQCPPEASGLREVYFAYDDEQDYIAKALEIGYQVLQGGTSIYAHPVILSVLVDDEGIVRGIRIVTDDRIADSERRVAVNLIRNLKARFKTWEQSCEDVPPSEGENPVGRQFVHEVCTAESPDADQRFTLEAYYLRKRGQEAVNRETQQVNRGYFASGTRMELVEVPYEPTFAVFDAESPE